MTRYHAITTCNARQWGRHGRRMASTFVRYWPAAVPLWLYTEGFDDDQAVDRYLDLHKEAPWLRLWQEGHAGANGKANGQYNYQKDAIRFSYKVAAVAAAADESDADVLIWLDADTITHAPVTIDWLDSLFPGHEDIAWLDRVGKYPECGFVMYRLPEALDVIRGVVRLYRTDELFKLSGQTDCHALQHVVQQLNVKTHSLSGDARTAAHPFVNSALGSRMDHLKGPRKDAGRSRPADLTKPRSEAYWR